LDIRRDASDVEIKQAYRRLALQYHPQKHKDNNSIKQFQLISEAYDVLTDGERRAIFNQYGEIGLKRGVKNELGSLTTPYTFTLPPTELFTSVFGTPSPYSAFFDYHTTDSLNEQQLADKQGKKGTAKNEKNNAETQEIKLFVSLEEVYRGCQKKIKINRKRISPDGSLLLDSRYLTVDLMAGWKNGTRITFAGEGDQLTADSPMGDVTFIVTDKPHPLYKRSATNDLLYQHQLTLSSALCGSLLELRLLDDRLLTIALNEISTPYSEKIVSGEGLPKSDGTRGNLIITFQIQFPEQLTLEQKAGIKKFLE